MFNNDSDFIVLFLVHYFFEIHLIKIVENKFVRLG